MVVFGKWLDLTDIHKSHTSKYHVVHLYYRENLKEFSWSIRRSGISIERGFEHSSNWDKIKSKLEEILKQHDIDYAHELNFGTW